MTNQTLTAASIAASSHERANVARLSIAQALAGGNSAVAYSVGAVVGAGLAPNPALATLPITIFVIGMASSTLPAGAVASRWGRRAAFLIGTGCGIAMGLLAALSIYLASFWLFCVALFFGGAYAAAVLTFRFAAADCAPTERRARAVSLVMAGGLFGGVIGPQLVTYTMNIWPPFMFAATFLGSAGLAALSALILAGVTLPTPPRHEVSRGRPLLEIARQPRFLVAALSGATSYMLMNFIMTSAPLAMKICGLPQTAANLGLQWHIIGMYAPGFLTGRLIQRFGAAPMVLVGLTTTLSAAIAGLTGVDVAHFWTNLILLGVGWNFSFTGASVMVLDTHRPEERTRVQSLNDFLVFGTMVVGSFVSGGLLTEYGWQTVCWTMIPPLALTALAIALWRRSPSESAEAA